MSEQNQHVTKTSLIPCFSIGKQIFAPQLTIERHGDNTLFEGSLISPLLKQQLAGSLGQRLGITPDQLDINLADTLSWLGINLDDTLHQLFNCHLTKCDIKWHKNQGSGYIIAETEHLTIKTIILTAVTGQKTLNIITAKITTELSELVPLIDTDNLPDFSLALAIVYLSDNFSAADISAINNLISQTELNNHSILTTLLQNTSLAAGTKLMPKITLGEQTIPLILPLRSEEQAPNKINPLLPATSSSKMNANLGPISIDNFSVGLQEGDLRLSIDGYLTMSKFQLVLIDMALTANIQQLMTGNYLESLGFDLAGLYASLDLSGFSFSGGLLRNDNAADNIDYEFNGQMALKTTTVPLSLTAVASYAKMNNGTNSLFAYLAVNYPIGGVPAFFVEGLALGFGYNRGVRIPPIEQVNQFPLVTALAENETIGHALTPETLAKVKQRFNSLSNYLPVSEGEYVIAAGLQFSTFKLLYSTAVLMVKFGHYISVSLVGTSRLSIPRNVAKPVLSVEMAFLATFQPQEGFFGIQAQLTDRSYLLSPQCKMTGGFAYYQWYAGQHASDFVISLGGYHPKFNKPQHYPSVPRLGFNWQITEQVSAKGELYGALTPAMMMAGGLFDISYRNNNGEINAGLKANADFLIAWQPFYYSANAATRIHVSYRANWWPHPSASGSVGVSLDLWGPDFSGRAHCKLFFINLTIDFGDAEKSAPEPISWQAFEQAYLPEEINKYAELSIINGQRMTLTIADEPVYVVDPDDFELLVSSTVPVNRLRLNNEIKHTGPDFTIAPSNCQRISPLDNNEWELLITSQGSSDIELTPYQMEYKNYPKAIYGDEFIPTLTTEQSAINLLSGARFRPADIPAAPSENSENLTPEQLSYALTLAKQPSWQWHQPLNHHAITDSTANNRVIRQTINQVDVITKRQSIAELFDHQLAIDLAATSKNLNTAFIGTPMVMAQA